MHRVRAGLRLIDLPVFAANGGPVHDRVIVGSQPGLYFVGLVFSYALASSLVGGVGRDAEHIAKHIASRQPSSWPTPFCRQTPNEHRRAPPSPTTTR